MIIIKIFTRLKNVFFISLLSYYLVRPPFALSVVITAHRMKWRRFGYLKVKKKNERGISFLWLIEEKDAR
jgi:hypothetical protein